MVAMTSDQLEVGEAVIVASDGLTINQAGPRPGSAATAAAASGNRLVKSLPLRVMSRTLAASRRAMMRKLSCLISRSLFGPGRGNFSR